MKVTALTRKGVNKLENEDRIVVGSVVISDGPFTCNLHNCFLAIADGVGGNNAGATASHFVSEAISRASGIDPEMFETINERLIEESLKDSRLEKMATTLTGINFSDVKRTVFHIGNTRAYTLANGKYLRQLTTDDTTVQHLLTYGRLSDEEAKQYVRKNEITACFGAGNNSLFKLKVIEMDVQKYPIFLLTSDGIHDYLTTDDLEEIIGEYCSAFSIACEEIMKMAIKKGSVDDMSIIIADTH